MTQMSIPDAAVGPIVAAVVAGSLACIAAILTKENKTSEFRQAWIDALRAEIADAISHASTLLATFKVSDEKNVWEDVKESYEGYRRAVALIKLRLNPSEDSSKKIIALLDDIEHDLSEVTKEEGLDHTQLKIKISQNLSDETQPVLKAEWERVKRGERIYRYALGGGVVMMVGGLAAGAIALVFAVKAVGS